MERKGRTRELKSYGVALIEGILNGLEGCKHEHVEMERPIKQGEKHC